MNTRIQAFVKEDYAVCIYKSLLCTKVSGLRVVLQPHFICFLPLFFFFFSATDAVIPSRPLQFRSSMATVLLLVLALHQAVR